MPEAAVTQGNEPAWLRFRDEAAAIVKVPAESLTPQTRPFVELSIDSLALAELAAFFAADYGAEFVLEAPEAEWMPLTMHQLLAACTGSAG